MSASDERLISGEEILESYPNLTRIGGGDISDVFIPDTEGKPAVVIKVEKKPGTSLEHEYLPKISEALANANKPHYVPSLIRSGILKDGRRVWEQTFAKGERVFSNTKDGLDLAYGSFKGQPIEFCCVLAQMMDLCDVLNKIGYIPDDKKWAIDTFVDRENGKVTIIDWDFIQSKEATRFDLRTGKMNSAEDTWKVNMRFIAKMGLISLGGTTRVISPYVAYGYTERVDTFSEATSALDSRTLIIGIDPAVQVILMYMHKPWVDGETPSPKAIMSALNLAVQVQGMRSQEEFTNLYRSIPNSSDLLVAFPYLSDALRMKVAMNSGNTDDYLKYHNRLVEGLPTT